MFVFKRIVEVIFLWIIMIGNSSAQLCTQRNYVTKTRIQWNNGERLTTKRGWLGNTKYKYEPYMYSTTQYYTDYETVFVCCQGYKKNGSSQCDPVCQPTCPANSHCVRPNVCECSSGYFSYSSHPSIAKCEPVCYSGCSENSRCTSPGVCSCSDGYKKNAEGKCVAICNPACPANAECLKPNQCSCSKGYEKVENTSGNETMICRAICSPECPENSLCSKPNECVCLEGYTKKEDKCEPLCDSPCLENAFCKSPNQCECLEGYELEEETLACVAQCKNECPENAFCSKPNQCECKQGYAMTTNATCEPVCETKCPENARCTAPNTCSCLKGYKMLENNQCEPVCEKPCPENAHCTKPNKCECLNGYQLKMTSIYNIYCEPQCQNDCSTFGKCVAPNKCECFEGYEMDEMEQCRPICKDGCLNGLCYRPEVCICNAGYLMGPHNSCEPTCSLPCQNGTCVEPEICKCSEGYKLQEGSVNICEPLCEPECHNGMCVEPNICICHENYEPIEISAGSYNHSYCQKVTTTTTTYVQESTTTVEDISITETRSTIIATSPSVTPPPQNILHTTPYESTTTSTLQKCLQQCQCWQEHDDLGSISSTPQCVHLCLDPYDKLCLNLSLCHCDVAKSQLVCQIDEEDSDEEPLMYICKIPRPSVTTITTTISTTTAMPSNEMIITTDSNEKSGNILWIVVASIMGICGITALAFVAYWKYFKPEDPLIYFCNGRNRQENMLQFVNLFVTCLGVTLLAQQFSFIFQTAEAKAYEQTKRSRYASPSSYIPNSRNQYQSEAAATRYAPNALVGNIQRRGGDYSNDCDSEGGNQTHMYTITISNEDIDKYTYIKILEKKARHTTISLCCEGYTVVRNWQRDICVPVCENCRNGKCVGPNECECYDGFVRNDNGDCVFSCPLGCLNGRCYLDGSCKCDPGYKLDETRRFCRPICSKGCGTNTLLNCTAPEVCGCINGYILTDHGCKAVCDPECGPGGECNASGKCECKSGYTLKDGVCHAVCYQPCENGMCYSRHRCICNPGFIYMESTGNCIPMS
ncbi:uncharacterized protein [Musca autumnalis]|uniref:uncharacterized protein n=1 Tax=Musca autumnalis TaxID=221902 RepID=UPI003CE75279